MTILGIWKFCSWMLIFFVLVNKYSIVEKLCAAGENNPLQANERPVVYILKQRQKSPFSGAQRLFDGNALPSELVQYTVVSSAVKRKLSGEGTYH
jgi:hypothetical protein